MSLLTWPLYALTASAAASGPRAARAIDRLAKQFHDTVTVTGVVAAVANEVQALVDALNTLRLLRTASALTGAPLDILGSILGQAREGRSDAEYRLWITARALVNRSHGTAEDLLAVARALGLTDASVTPSWPAGVILSTGFLLGVVNPNPYYQILSRSLAAGVRLLLEYGSADEAHTLIFDSIEPLQAWDAGQWRGVVG